LQTTYIQTFQAKLVMAASARQHLVEKKVSAEKLPEELLSPSPTKLDKAAGMLIDSEMDIIEAAPS